ncbi:MAG TPA: hypothetical protein VLJ19_04805 [Variovorax sp.]|nr:hypothetical protein [Variovorax sp.]
MSILDFPLPRGGTPAGLQRFVVEVAAFFDTLLHPGRILAEVEQMGVLLSAANALQGTDPARAAALRRRASRIGLD